MLTASMLTPMYSTELGWTLGINSTSKQGSGRLPSRLMVWLWRVEGQVSKSSQVSKKEYPHKQRHCMIRSKKEGAQFTVSNLEAYVRFTIVANNR